MTAVILCCVTVFCLLCVFILLYACLFRSKIRIRDGRAKPIDLLAKYISAEDDDLAVEMHEPYTFLNGLTVTDMDDLLEDIKVCSDPTGTLIQKGKAAHSHC